MIHMYYDMQKAVVCNVAKQKIGGNPDDPQMGQRPVGEKNLGSPLQSKSMNRE